MNTISEKDKDFAWCKGFEAGVAFTLRRLTEDGVNVNDICKLIGDLQTLRTWKTAEEWRDLVERNCITDGGGYF